MTATKRSTPGQSYPRECNEEVTISCNRDESSSHREGTAIAIKSANQASGYAGIVLTREIVNSVARALWYGRVLFLEKPPSCCILEWT